LGVFTYSLEPGTPAVKLDGHLPETVKTERRDALMALQQPIAFEHAESLIGYELDVLIDEQAEVGGFVGRTFADAPEIDACVRVEVADPSTRELAIGEFLPVEITGREGYDLVGTVQ
jgi:ribosomal protein S12 methylthiotransferase